jgi:hypothetical protein
VEFVLNEYKLYHLVCYNEHEYNANYEYKTMHLRDQSLVGCLEHLHGRPQFCSRQGRRQVRFGSVGRHSRKIGAGLHTGGPKNLAPKFAFF